MSPKTYFQIVAGTLSISVLAACGGGGGSSATPSNTATAAALTANGILLDAPVEGARYVSGGVTGLTDTSGTFEYEVGNTVRFYIGDVLLGEAPGKPMISPVDFVSGADIDDDTVMNITRLLQTVDADGNPDNGIQITRNMHDLAKNQSMAFSQSAAAFENDGKVQILVGELTTVTEAGARNLVSSAIAKNHLRQSIWNYYAGSYEGSFSGDDAGSFTLAFGADGAIAGTGTSSTSGAFPLSGSLGTDGSFKLVADGTNAGAAFSGSITADKTISGSWGNGAVSNGMFSGRYSAPISTPAPPRVVKAPIGSPPPEGDPGSGR